MPGACRDAGRSEAESRAQSPRAAAAGRTRERHADTPSNRQIVARGEAELGFQQVAEGLPVRGITFAGKLPGPMPKVTVCSAGISSAAKRPETGRAPIDGLGAPRPIP